jgi:GalNAc5-diNAcBac-PP-undecaprenol beta-1,3-glucosyltransferase
MEARPFVTIVTPTYNRAYCLDRSISSVLSQSFRDLELIIVDDGSTDGTAEMLKGYTDERIRVVVHESNRGVAAAKNTGLDNARGDWIGILDSDDEYLPGALERLVDRIRSISPDEKLGTIIGNSMRQDGTLTGLGVAEDGFIPYKDLISGRVRGEFTGLFSRAVLGASRLDEKLLSFESTLWLELYKRSSTYYMNFPVRIYHVGNPDQLSSSTTLSDRSARMVYGYSVMLQKHGPDFIKHCPARYGYYLRRKAFFERMSGSNREAVSDIVKAFKWSKENIREWILVTSACLLPRRLTSKLLERIYTITRET